MAVLQWSQDIMNQFWFCARLLAAMNNYQVSGGVSYITSSIHKNRSSYMVKALINVYMNLCWRMKSTDKTLAGSQEGCQNAENLGTGASGPKIPKPSTNELERSTSRTTPSALVLVKKIS